MKRKKFTCASELTLDDAPVSNDVRVDAHTLVDFWEDRFGWKGIMQEYHDAVVVTFLLGRLAIHFMNLEYSAGSQEPGMWHYREIAAFELIHKPTNFITAERHGDLQRWVFRGWNVVERCRCVNVSIKKSDPRRSDFYTGGRAFSTAHF